MIKNRIYDSYTIFRFICLRNKHNAKKSLKMKWNSIPFSWKKLKKQSVNHLINTSGQTQQEVIAGISTDFFLGLAFVHYSFCLTDFFEVKNLIYYRFVWYVLGPHFAIQFRLIEETPNHANANANGDAPYVVLEEFSFHKSDPLNWACDEVFIIQWLWKIEWNLADFLNQHLINTQ